MDIHELLNFSTIFLLPSFLELHSIAILEALSCAVPVVASDGVGCNSEFFTNDKDGLLLDPFSKQGWAEALIHLLKEEEFRRLIGQNGAALCRSQFNIQAVAKKFERLYEELGTR